MAELIKDPIIIDPPGQTPADVWKECEEWVERKGGMVYPDGEPNIAAAFGADPGCCGCPNCQQVFWSCGNIIQCTECNFQFPTDWWGMYSYGVNASRPDPPYVAGLSQDARARLDQLHQDRLSHPYYKYGFEHPVADAWEAHDKLPWKEIVSSESERRSRHLSRGGR